jgi:hypothetical protein
VGAAAAGFSEVMRRDPLVVNQFLPTQISALTNIGTATMLAVSSCACASSDDYTIWQTTVQPEFGEGCRVIVEHRCTECILRENTITKLGMKPCGNTMDIWLQDQGGCGQSYCTRAYLGSAVGVNVKRTRCQTVLNGYSARYKE